MDTSGVRPARVGDSYWTERRTIRENVSDHMQSIQEWINETTFHCHIDQETSDDCELNIDTSNSKSDQCNKSSDELRCVESDSNTNVFAEPQNFTFDDMSETSYSSWYSCGQSSSESEPFDDDIDEETDETTRSELARWASIFNISHEALKYLLQIMQKKYPQLPIDPRTLLKTQTRYTIKQIDGGKYHHFGIEAGINKLIKCSSIESLPEVFNIQINIDGLPLYKSSKVQFWPILGRIVELKESCPFIIGLFCGEQKPGDIEEYLKDFIDDMYAIKIHGVLVNLPEKNIRIVVPVQVQCFICDAPARAFVKQVKAHNSYQGCEKCIQHGVYIDRLTFPELRSALRTDTSFNEVEHPRHHIGVSPLRKLEIGMVSQFVLDSMHLIYLGVMKRLLWLWMKGPVRNKCRIGSIKVRAISERLTAFHPYIPREFARKCRPLSHINHWKATEYRQFLLYSGIVALKSNIPPTFYKHFLLLFVAIFCLSSPVYSTTHCTFANELLILFVSHFGRLYGKEMIVYNVHNLVHVAAEVEKFGPLDSISAFEFESYLGRLKKLVRKPNLPLAQVIRRLSESMHMQSRQSNKYDVNRLLLRPNKQHYSGPCPAEYKNYSQYHGVQYGRFYFSTKQSDNCIRINNQIGLIRNILSLGDLENTLVLYEPFKHISNYFEFPLHSSDLGINIVDNLSGTLKAVTLDQIDCKYIRLPCNNHYLVVPLLHQFK